MKKNNHDLYQIARIEISYSNPVEITDRFKVQNPDDAHRVFRLVWDENKIELLEQCKILLLDTGGFCLGVSDVSTGGISGCICDPRIIFSTALLSRANGIVLAHNHPSGNLKPSSHDMDITRKLKNAGDMLDIQVMDHLILNRNHFYSFSNDGCMPG